MEGNCRVKAIPKRGRSCITGVRRNAGEHFGWLAEFVGFHLAASGALTQERLGWHPTGPGMVSDLENMRYLPA
jgi:hypothetical protein